MATVGELTEPYGGFLLLPRPAGPGVCVVCRAALAGDYDRCYPCQRALGVAPLGLADAVVPISIAVKGEQFASELWRYKNFSDKKARGVLRLRLAAVLWRFLAVHEPCVATAARTASFDLVTTVPSTGGRVEHPLREIAGGIVASTRGRYADLLVSNPDVPVGRDVRPDRFLRGAGAQVDLFGASVLLIDDTWTQGGHAQSAACALKRAGADRVAVVVLGRHLDPGFGDNTAYLHEARKTPYSWDACCVHSAGLW